jgi:hypothetical protein
MSDLLELAMNAHGGLDRWREINTLDLRMSLTGNLFRTKGVRAAAWPVPLRRDRDPFNPGRAAAVAQDRDSPPQARLERRAESFAST